MKTLIYTPTVRSFGSILLVLTLLMLLVTLAPPTVQAAQDNGNGAGYGGSTSGGAQYGGDKTSENGGAAVADTDTSGGSDTGQSSESTGGSAGNSGGGSGSTGGTGGGQGSSGGPGGEEPTAGNNLSFPVITVDGYGLTKLTTESFTSVYDGPYTGLTNEELDRLAGHDWYAQKTEGNTWQADFLVQDIGTPLAVFGIDWGDNIEVVNPVIGRPFRLEITPYIKPTTPLAAYEMALLAFPSSPNETQGTNGETYDSEFATALSSRPQLVIQYVDDTDPDALTWNGEAWSVDGKSLPQTVIEFAPELNIAGKYIYGASQGGWRPVEPGLYRITFAVPGSDIDLSDTVIGNIADWLTATTSTDEDEEETHAAVPVVDATHNITYADVTVVTRHEGRKPADPGGEEEEAITETLATTDLKTTEVDVTLSCEPYLTDYLGQGRDNDPVQVVRLQDFLNDTLGTNIPLTGYFGPMTESIVKLFQTKYADTILDPWVAAGYDEVTGGTGYVYLTTLDTINDMVCES